MRDQSTPSTLPPRVAAVLRWLDDNDMPMFSVSEIVDLLGKIDETTEHPEMLTRTERLLSRAAEIDPEAWNAPLPIRMQARRNRSYKAAVQEMMGP